MCVFRKTKTEYDMIEWETGTLDIGWEGGRTHHISI
jgi:hypothetical protein